MVNMPKKKEVEVRKAIPTKLIAGIVVLSVLVGAGGTFSFFLVKGQVLGEKTAKLTPEKEVAEVVAKVGAIAVLPSDTPQVATVTDVSKLSAQPFFKNAQNGDKVLIYAGYKKAVLYRPSANKIVEMGPVTANATPTVTATVTPAKTVKKDPAKTFYKTPTPKK